MGLLHRTNGAYRPLTAALVVTALPLLLPRPCGGQEAAVTARVLLETARSTGQTDREAVGKLLQPASVAKISELRLLLGDADPFLRRMAAIGLAALGDFPARGLARLLGDEEKQVREAAEESLVAAGPRAVEPVGDLLANASCLSEPFKAALRILGRIGDPAAIPYLSGALVKYRDGGFPQAAAMGALKQIGGPSAIGQLLQLTAYRELGEEAYLTLLSEDPGRLEAAIVALLEDGGEDPELRLFYAAQLNEVFGSERAAPALVGFYGRVAADPALPEETRKKGAILRNLFGKVDDANPLYRAPLTRKRLNAMFAVRKEDEESPFMDARREQERKMDEIRAARKRETQQPLFFPMRPIHSGPR